MNIQWFPGHMAKALRMMRENAAGVDCFVYVLDARAIAACRNPEFDDVIAGKPVLFLINKIDLTERADCARWEKYFAARGENALFVSGIDTRGRTEVTTALRRINRAAIEKFAAKGAKKRVRAMVVGVPNTGKSTIINSLCAAKRAVTGNRPGVTRGKQWISLGEDVDLLDTPGTLPPFFGDPIAGVHLAMIGCIREETYDAQELACELVAFCARRAPEAFRARYGAEASETAPFAALEALARNKGMLLSGGRVDTERAASALADDFRKTRLGKLMLEFPPEEAPHE